MPDVNRRELKYRLNAAQVPAIRRRLSAFLLPDGHGGADGYSVRSLYFDTPADSDFWDKVDGIDCRQKIRLRIYGESGPVKLELKQKSGGFQRKRSIPVSREEAAALMAGNWGFLRQRQEPVAGTLYRMLLLGCYRPKCIVQYRRVALYAPENDIRVTFDCGLRASESNLDLFDYSAPLYPVEPPGAVTLEVKYSGFLFSNVKLALGREIGAQISNSKYCRARSISKHGGK